MITPPAAAFAVRSCSQIRSMPCVCFRCTVSVGAGAAGADLSFLTSMVVGHAWARCLRHCRGSAMRLLVSTQHIGVETQAGAVGLHQPSFSPASILIRTRFRV